jgi:tRNA-2-methylthio-N6-dimethylallyladenosine synthase
MLRLAEVVERSALRRHEARIGAVEDVLIEGPSKKDPSVWSGRSRHNKLVHLAPPSAGALVSGEYVDARIAAAAPHWLRGEHVRRVRPTRSRRVRIPVSASPA